MKKIKVMNRDGSSSLKTRQEIDAEFVARFRKLTDQELIDAFNCQVGNPGWVTVRALYLAALYDEFQHRGFDCSAISAEHSFSLRNKIRLNGKLVERLNTSKSRPNRAIEN